MRLALVDVAVALALSPSYRSRFGGCERGRRSSSASRSSRGRSCCERSRSSDRCRSQRGGSRSRRAWSRSSDRYRSRRDLSRCARSRSFARCRSHRERARFPCLSGGAARSFAIARSPESLAWPLAVMRAITCFSCPLAGRGSGPAGQTWATGGCGGLCLSASCGLVQRRASLLFWGGVHCRSPVCFFQELARFVMSLSGSSSLGASGVLAGVTASAAASWGIACPASAAAGAATLCAATVTPAGAGVFACCSRCCSWRVW